MNNLSFCLVLLSVLFLVSCTSSGEGDKKRDVEIKQEKTNKEDDFESSDESFFESKIKNSDEDQKSVKESVNESGERKSKLIIENIPSGKYTLGLLVEALDSVHLNGEGSLIVYDDRGKIENVDKFEHDLGDIEFTFVAMDVAGEVAVELTELITLIQEPNDEKEETPEEEKPEEEKPEEEKPEEEKPEEEKPEEKTVKVDPGYEKKAILIVVDGVNYNTLSGLELTNLDSLYKSKAYTGGIVGDGNEQKTLPEVGWVSILTGVWANKHGIKSSSDKLVSTEFKSIFTLLYGHFKAKQIDFTQSGIIRSPHLKSDYFDHDLEFVAKGSRHAKDSEAVDAAVKQINNETDFIFLQLADASKASSGSLGTAYKKSLASMDEQLGRILEAIKSSGNSDRLLLLTSSHGVTTTGDSGGQSADQKRVFIASNKSLNEEFSTPIDGSNKTLAKLYSQPAITSILPTLLSYFDIPLHRDLKLDGLSLLGNLGIQKLMFDKTTNKLTWRSLSSDDIDIYNNGKRINSIEANKGEWVLSDMKVGINDFVFLLNDQPVSYRYHHAREYTEVLAAMDWDRDGGSYDYEFIFLFFSNNYVARLRKGDLGLDDVFTLGDSGLFNEMRGFSDTVSANVPWDVDIRKSYFFFNNGQKVSTYDRDDGTFVDDPPKNNDWDELSPYKGLLTATCMTSNGDDDRAYFFLKDSRYFTYDVADEDVDYGPDFSHTNWDFTEQEGKDITACVRLNSTLYLFFLKGGKVIKYNNSTNKKLSGYPKPLEEEWSNIYQLD